MAFSSDSVNPYQIIWKIPHFRTVRQNDTCHSPVFPSDQLFAFQMTLYQDAPNEEEDNYVNIDLNMVKGNGREHLLNYRISFLDSKGDKRFVSGSKDRFRESDDTLLLYYQYSGAYVLDLIENDCFYGGSIYIHCEIEVPGLKIGQLSERMQELLNSGIHSDVTLVFGSGRKEFAVHKAILATRSPVFNAMFQNNFKENLENKVEIPDIDPEVGEEMLNFIYTEKAPNLDQLALELLTVSERYQMESLKQVCELSLSAKLTIKSVASVLVLADTHQALQLKEKCLDFIRDNYKQFLKTRNGWKDVSSRADFLALLFERLALKK